jgi:chorismate-pyruvate lyase
LRPTAGGATIRAVFTRILPVLAAMPPPDSSAIGRALSLVREFCPEPAGFGRFQERKSDAVPEPARRLLDHHSHMTVAMERFHGVPVGLRIVAERPAAAGNRYAREILLVRGDGRVVQHGIVRLDLGAVPPDTAAAIRAGRAPLGRILIDAGLLCDVQRIGLLEVAVGPHLATLLGIPEAAVAFGRVAEIRVGGALAVELLEIVAPA